MHKLVSSSALSDSPTSAVVIFAITALIAIIGMAIKYLGYRVNSKKVSTLQITALSDLFPKNLSRASKQQKYLIELSIQNLYGKIFSYNEIYALLRCNNSSAAFSEYHQIRFFTQLSNSNKTVVIKPQEGRLSIHGRTPLVTGLIFLCLYFFLASTGFYGAIKAAAMILNNMESNSSVLSYTIAGAILTISFVSILASVKSLNAVFKKKLALEFINRFYPSNSTS